ncbi:kynureninase [Brevibacterium jeotgali]|uniref:Kynureninase n=1 Tax=Brevibacterium jeotgali TaxID=1262550 RepID=A0A2H1L5K0_9MICO|nr:kynureninase [Brevibacterium jeotgali]TWC01383.1 kynureninase [Brevibacterium jeotgali]SMY12162.1 Kynureninase [Brevibacterium jeotgali]
MTDEHGADSTTRRDAERRAGTGTRHGADHGLAVLEGRARSLDAADRLAAHRGAFAAAPGVVSYLDGNSLGRPTADAAERLRSFTADQWGGRLIRGWEEGWFEKPLTLGDRLGSATLGAGPGQTFIGESTTVVLYKLIHAALDMRPDRTEIIADSANFPTDRYLIHGIAEERGLTVRWLEPTDVDAAPSDATVTGIRPDQVADVASDTTALVLLSHIDYRTGYIADLPAITDIAHRAGALVVWDLCHSAGAMPLELDEWDVDFAAGCTYKYLNGGPGSPAFGYVASRHIRTATQPIRGWMGVANAFEMGPSYEPHPGIRRFVSGTPAVLGMVPLESMLDLVDEAGMEAIRAKSTALTDFVVELFDELLAPLGVRLGSPRDGSLRGGHVTIHHDLCEAALPALWERGIIPDFRRPNGLRLGPSPLSTGFTEAYEGVLGIRDALLEAGASGG